MLAIVCLIQLFFVALNVYFVAELGVENAPLNVAAAIFCFGCFIFTVVSAAR